MVIKNLKIRTTKKRNPDGFHDVDNINENEQPRISAQGNPEGKVGSSAQGNPEGKVGASAQGNPEGKVGAPAQGNPEGKVGASAQGNPEGKVGASAQGNPEGKVGASAQGNPEDKVGASAQGNPEGKVGASAQGNPEGNIYLKKRQKVARKMIMLKVTEKRKSRLKNPLNKTEAERKNSLKSLKCEESCFEALIKIEGTIQEAIVNKLFTLLMEDNVSDVLSTEAFSSMVGCSVETFLSESKKLYRKGIIDRIGFNRKNGGSVYWLHPIVQSIISDSMSE